MQKINLVYDGAYHDADILLVPDWVAECAVQWPGLYSRWLFERGEDVMETEGFVQWLNAQIDDENEKVRIVQQHVSVDEAERSIDF